MTDYYDVTDYVPYKYTDDVTVINGALRQRRELAMNWYFWMSWDDVFDIDS